MTDEKLAAMADDVQALFDALVDVHLKVAAGGVEGVTRAVDLAVTKMRQATFRAHVRALMAHVKALRAEAAAAQGADKLLLESMIRAHQEAQIELLVGELGMDREVVAPHVMALAAGTDREQPRDEAGRYARKTGGA